MVSIIEPSIFVYFNRNKDNNRLANSLIGISGKQFDELVADFEKAHAEIQQERLENGEIKRLSYGGVSGYLSTFQIKLFFILFYLKNYNTFDTLGAIFQLGGADAHGHIEKLLPILTRALSNRGDLPVSAFSTPEELRQALDSFKEVLIDATECPCVRPSDEEEQKKRYSGKKKRHTIKSMIVATPAKMIVMVSLFVAGSTHDYALFKELFNPELDWFKNINVYFDLGFFGVVNDYPKNKGINIPYKKPRKSKNNPNTELTKSQKAFNKKQASIRVAIENSIAGMKAFHCTSHRIRNHLDIFINYFLSLSAGLWNLKNAVK